MNGVGVVVSVVPTFKWEVNVDCFENKSTGKYLMSPVFYTKNNFSGLNQPWQLLLYPKGKSREDKDFIGLFLFNLDDNDIVTTVSLAFLNQNRVKVLESIFENETIGKHQGYGFSKLVESSYIRNPENHLLKGKILTILCNVMIAGKRRREDEQFEGTESVKRLKFLDDFEDLFSNSELSDVTIVTADRKNLKLHKNILSVHSRVFHLMFTTDMREKSKNKVIIKDFQYEVLQEFFRFMYTGKVSNTKGIISDLLMAAEKYYVQELKEFCEKTMGESLTRKNAIEYLNLALIHNAEKLKSDAINYISSLADYFLEDYKFNEFGLQNPTLLLEIFKKSRNL